MASFDLRKELMEINDKLANLNAMVNENNKANLEVNYQILHTSLKSLMQTVKKVFPQYENELLGENLDMIRLLSKEIVSHCPVDYKQKEEDKSKKSSRYEPLNSENATNV